MSESEIPIVEAQRLRVVLWGHVENKEWGQVAVLALQLEKLIARCNHCDGLFKVGTQQLHGAPVETLHAIDLYHEALSRGRARSRTKKKRSS